MMAMPASLRSTSRPERLALAQGQRPVVDTIEIKEVEREQHRLGKRRCSASKTWSAIHHGDTIFPPDFKALLKELVRSAAIGRITNCFYPCCKARVTASASADKPEGPPFRPGIASMIAYRHGRQMIGFNRLTEVCLGLSFLTASCLLVR
jgi:hypothetical protein